MGQKIVNLSKHFHLWRLTLDAHALDRGIANTPEGPQLENLRALCTEVLEPLLSHVGRPTIIAAFRCRELNAFYGSDDTSPYLQGRAVDLFIPNAEIARKYLTVLATLPCKTETFQGKIHVILLQGLSKLPPLTTKNKQK